MTAAIPTRTFSIGQVLTVACADAKAQQLFCSYSDLLDVLGYLLQDVPLAEEIPAAIQECRPAVLDAYPDLRQVGPPPFDAPDAAVLTWISHLEQEHGTTLPLRPIDDEVGD